VELQKRVTSPEGEGGRAERAGGGVIRDDVRASKGWLGFARAVKLPLDDVQTPRHFESLSVHKNRMTRLPAASNMTPFSIPFFVFNFSMMRASTR